MSIVALVIVIGIPSRTLEPAIAKTYWQSFPGRAGKRRAGMDGFAICALKRWRKENE